MSVVSLFRNSSEPKEHQLRMFDTLVSQVHWREQNGYLRFCHKILRAPRPRNSREVTKLPLALQSIIQQQIDRAEGKDRDLDRSGPV